MLAGKPLRLLVVMSSLAACSRDTSVRVKLALADGAPAPDALTVSVFDRFGGVAYGVPLAARLPGDVLILLSRDAGMARVVALGSAGGQLVVGGASATAISPGRESPMPLVLSATLPLDTDGDGVPDVIDDCPTVADPDQTNSAGSGPGDACLTVDTPADFALLPGAVDLGTAPAANHDLAELPVVAAPSCGDGVVQAPEACDDGAANSDDPAAAATCTSLCRLRAACGSSSGASSAQIDPATGHCYLSWPGPLSWADASRQCQARGGHLATVTTAAENAIIQTLSGPSDRWIGLEIDHSAAVRDHWVDGEAVAFSQYASGDPKNLCSSGTPESCGAFEAARAGWDDRQCGFPSAGLLPASYAYGLGYVCENECGNGVVDPGEGCDPAGAGCTPTCQTIRACSEPGGVVSPINGHCYFSLTTPLTFGDALTACPTGTHLATLDEIAETEAGELAVTGGDAWIALRTDATQADWSWIIGADIFDSLRYHGFSSPDPDETSAPPYCARLTTTGWRDRQCSLLYPALCER